MNLREQISELIYDCRNRTMNNGRVELTEEYYVDTILKIFEKRIDEKLEETKNDQNKIPFNDPVIKQHYDTRIEAFQEIKEILK